MLKNGKTQCYASHICLWQGLLYYFYHLQQGTVLYYPEINYKTVCDCHKHAISQSRSIIHIMTELLVFWGLRFAQANKQYSK